MEKLHTLPSVIRDGKIGVLISPGFGAGFHTWGAPLEAIVNPTLVELVDKRYNMEFVTNENGKIKQRVDVWDTQEYIELNKEIMNFVETNYPSVFTGGVDDLVVQWIPIGTHFNFNEYDGSESLIYRDEMNWIEV